MKVIDNGDGTYKGVISEDRECVIVPSHLKGFYNIDFCNGRKAYFYTMYEIENLDFEWKFKTAIKDRTGAEKERPDGSVIFVRDYKLSADMEVVLFRGKDIAPTFLHHISWSTFKNNLVPVKIRKNWKKTPADVPDDYGKWDYETNQIPEDVYMSGYAMESAGEMLSGSGSVATEGVADTSCGGVESVGSEDFKQPINIAVGTTCNLTSGGKGIVLSAKDGKYRVMTEKGISVLSSSDLA